MLCTSNFLCISLREKWKQIKISSIIEYEITSENRAGQGDCIIGEFKTVGLEGSLSYLSDLGIFWTPISSCVKWDNKEYPPY